ncbi:MAG: ribosome maturation factor RimM [Pseudomonadota bacterium]
MSRRDDNRAPDGTEQFVVVGQIGTAHGIKGFNKVTSFTEPRTNLLAFSPWYLNTEHQWQRHNVDVAKPQGKGLVVKFEGVDDRDAALTLRGKQVAVHRTQLPDTDEDEYYWTDLIGLTMITLGGQTLGVIEDMMATGANDVMVVDDSQGKQRLVPFLQDQVVKNVDLETSTMHVDWDPDF